MKNDNDDNDDFRINPARFAGDVRSEPMQYLDDQVEGNDGERKIAEDAPLREDRRSINLGNASAQGSMRRDIYGDIRPALDDHKGTEARLLASEPRRDLKEQDLELDYRTVRALKSVPNHAIDSKRPKIADATKVVVLLGDTAILGTQLWRTGGTPLWLALAIGASLAGSVVAVGTACGHRIASAQQRKDRGAAPEDTDPLALPFYDDGRAEESYRLWLRAAFGAGLIMFLALFMLGKGSGDPGPLAAGFAFLGAITVAGSAAAQAFETNDCAEQIKQTERRIDTGEEGLREFEDNEYQAAATGIHAELGERAAQHGAVSVRATVTETANRATDTAWLGYVDNGRVPIAPEPPTPAEKPMTGSSQSVQRTRQRPKYSMHGELGGDALSARELGTVDLPIEQRNGLREVP